MEHKVTINSTPFNWKPDTSTTTAPTAHGSTPVTLAQNLPPRMSGGAMELQAQADGVHAHHASTPQQIAALESLRSLAERRAVEFDAHPHDPLQAVLLSGMLATLGRSGQGENVMRSCIERHPHNVAAHRELARCLHELGRVDEATGAANEALRLSKHDEKHLAEQLLKQFREGTYAARQDTLPKAVLDTIPLTFRLPARQELQVATSPLTRVASFLLEGK